MAPINIFLFLASLLVILGLAQGHGRLLKPPSRASLWRTNPGLGTPVDKNDNATQCGGFEIQYEQNGGKCGVCGDPWQGPREHEGGGKYATGVIVKGYRAGKVMRVRVELTTNHKGWFEFRLCPHNNHNTAVTQECLDRHLLKLADGSGTRYPISEDERMVRLKLRLPRRVTCTQCVLQWKYHSGDREGVDQETGESCLGCGPQVQYYACSDISIRRR